ncbi:hypothetical protein ACF3DV_22580 [Chlorogloeopsis fritschii PCC 9212]|uniref:Uncharacterized protein n=1 Tax=Chlorogloeopsis fritschii PCC 6912 TaxID=211165 RepID=A0A433N4C8_CHLFR|nr:hypothetical protein [Chlorogloeopsis fritschii]RUR76189.1 hypothetical protein PCC6912_43610 [Chlorogloeopsis fritschii PCC 6912]
MNKSLDEALSIDIGARIKSKAKKPFDNAYKAALATEGAIYVQGFLVIKGASYQPVEHSWIELGDRIVDPTLPHLHKKVEEIWYFPAQHLTVKRLKAIIEESKEDYPEDDPLPVYGEAPYEYYGDVMLGGKDYLKAYQEAEAKCVELNRKMAENN